MADIKDDAKSAASDSDDTGNGKTKRALKKAGDSVRQQGQRMSQQAQEEDVSRSNVRSPNSDAPPMQSYKRGGKVKKTGRAKLHRGEVVKKKAARKRGRL